MFKDMLDMFGTMLGLKVMDAVLGDDKEEKKEEPKEELEGKKGIKQYILPIMGIVLFITVAFGYERFDAYKNGRGKIHPPKAAEDYIGENYTVVKDSLISGGFTNVKLQKESRGLLELTKKKGTVKKVTINGDDDYGTSSWYSPKAKVRIIYY